MTRSSLSDVRLPIRSPSQATIRSELFRSLHHNAARRAAKAADGSSCADDEAGDDELTCHSLVVMAQLASDDPHSILSAIETLNFVLAPRPKAG
jgi:hypothetical protein